MIDLEDALAPLVEHAPDAPAVDRVVRRGRARRRRRVATLTTALVVVAAVAVGAVVTVANRSTPRVAGPTPPIDTVRVTLLDGSQLTISGPSSLGLADLAPGFNGSLAPATDPQWGLVGHGFSVDRTPPSGLGSVVGSYPTADGHTLVVHAAPTGVVAVVEYPGWWLSASWNDATARWAPFAAALDAKETADGYLVIEPAVSGWKLTPADAPEAQLGGDAYGSGASYAFWGPDMYPAGCPSTNEDVHTAEGWPVTLENGAWWCDPAQRVRVAAWDSTLVHDAIQGLHVAYNDADHAQATVTGLDGARYEITAPSSVLDHLILQATVAIDDLTLPTPIVVEVQRTGEGDANRTHARDSSYITGDGHPLGLTHFTLGDDALEASYGDWTVDIVATGASNGDRARVASLFAAHETADGWLVLDPHAPMHLTPGPTADIVLDGVSVLTTNGLRVVPERHDVQVRRVG